MNEPAKTPLDAGQVAYEAYCGYVGWISIRGEELPSFSHQEPRIQNAWRVAANAVLSSADNKYSVKLESE